MPNLFHKKNFSEHKTKNKDHIALILIVSSIIILGILAVWSATPIMAEMRYSDPYKFIIKHLLFIFMGILVFITAGFAIDYRKYQKFSKYIYILSIILLILPFVFGHPQKGAMRWIQLGPLNFQPSECAKIALIIVMADFLARKQKMINFFKYNWIPTAYFVIMIFIILCQKDLGTNILLTIVWISMLFISGISAKRIFAFAGSLFVLFSIFIVLYPYRLQRILDFKNSLFDISATSYNVKSALVAFGSGGFSGKGPGQSEMKLLHLPEMHTDFIFPIIGEEYGLLGTLFTIFMFIMFFKTGLSINKNCTNEFGKYLSFGIIVVIISQVIINMAMTMSLFPAKGLPLPFISYGGSSMIGTLLMTGILFNIARSNNK